MMEDRAEIRVKFKIGEIEFEAEGSADLVERERSIFSNTLLPSAIDAIVRTRGVAQTTQYIEAIEQPTKLLSAEGEVPEQKQTPILHIDSDFSRTNLTSHLERYGSLSEQDFTLFAAYYDEQKNAAEYFTKDSVEKYYDEARRTKPSNISGTLYALAKSAFIIDAPNVEQKMPKPYKVSDKGIEYIKSYKPKQETEKKTTKTRKPRTKIKSVYANINCDELNLNNYPNMKLLKDFKEKMMLILYIVTSEKKGEWFTTSDVLCLLTDIFGESATKKQVEGVFNREKRWFKAENVDGNNKSVHRKLLNQGKEFAQALIPPTT